MFRVAFFIVAKIWNKAMSINRWKSGTSRSSLLLSTEQTTDMHNTMDEFQKHYAEWKKSNTKNHVLCDSTYMKFWDKQN